MKLLVKYGADPNIPTAAPRAAGSSRRRRTSAGRSTGAATQGAPGAAAGLVGS